ncbi:MAG: hypothetical protein NTV05_09530 [Acidobacteria bacterium]|nr:hypothetical protein [Acidobacteriota bacterium]
METHWAAEQLQTIRTLMERSALYRRALEPIMLFAGALGVAAGAAGSVLRLDSMRAFGGLWLGTAAVAVVGAFLIARQQAIKDHEPFWSPPARRVAQALLPPLAAGMCIGLVSLLAEGGAGGVLSLSCLWVLLYGCALHAAGFFMPRGIRLFGWVFVAGACGLVCATALARQDLHVNPNLLMGLFFGVLHLAYGAYLHLSEKATNAA